VLPKETFPLPLTKPKPRGMRLLPLLAATYFMVSGGPYGLEDVIGFAGYGRALLLLLLLPVFWSLPTALMLGELSAAIPAEGGFYAWVRRAMGPFWGFQEAWLSLAASVFDMAVYPTIFVTYVAHLAPSVVAGHRGLAIKLAVVLLATLWNLRGANAVGRGSVWLWFVALSPFVALVGFAAWTGMHTPHASMGPPAQLNLSGAVLIAMWNYMGWDNATTIASEVDNPQRAYPRAMLLAALMVMLTYLVPIAAVAWAGIPPDRFSTGAWVDAARLLGGPLLAAAVVVAGSLDSMGTFNALTLSYTRLPYAMACDGLLPHVLTKRLRNGVPWVALLACATCWALALGLTFERLITIDLLLWGMSLLLEFAALILLRIREPNLARPFRIPGRLWVAVALGVGPAVLTSFALWTARQEHAAGMPAALFAVLIAGCGLPLYMLARRRTAAGASAD
jgi:amino acid transporter